MFGLQWRPIFLINVPITVTVVAAGTRFLPGERPPGTSKRLDLPGAATLSGAVLSVVLPLTLGRGAGWPVWTWICLALSLPLVGTFATIERRRVRRGRAPLVDLAVIRRPAIAWGLWAQALATATYYALLFTLALYLQAGRGESALVSGLALVPWVAAFGIPGRLLTRLPARARPMLPAAGGAILTVAYVQPA